MDLNQHTVLTDLGWLAARRATADDLPAVVDILADATAWLEARGIDQWHDYPNRAAHIAGRIARGEMWLGWLRDESIATIALQWMDEETWGPRPPDAGYVHSLAVRRACSGHGIGRALLDWAAGEVARAGRRLLRLDCVAHNAALRAYYESAGFTVRGTRTYPGAGESSSLYERPVGTLRLDASAESSSTMHFPARVATLAGALDVVLAGPGDVDDVTALYDEMTAWVRAQGFDPGAAPRPLREIVADRVATGAVAVARLQSEIVATMTILRVDAEVWGETPGDALYLHGFGVKRAYAGQRIGRALLDWLAETTAAEGRAYVRLDCEAGNRKLRDYYERAGFTYRGDVTLPSHIGSRYERRVGDG